MDYIEIAEWEKFQHYKYRNPPWVKLYSWFLDDDDFECMPDASKLLFFCLLSFASRRKNKIRHNFKWLQKKLPIESEITSSMLQPLIDAGFINAYQDASTPLADRKQSAIPEKTKVKKKREEQIKAKKPLGFSSVPGSSFKKLFNDDLKPETDYERNTLNKLAGACYKKQNSLPNYFSYLIDIIADLKEYCKVKGKGHSDLMKMFVSKIKKECNVK